MSLSSLNCVGQTCSLQQRMRHGMESVAIPLVGEEKTPWGGLPSLPPWPCSCSLELVEHVRGTHLLPRPSGVHRASGTP